MEGRFEGPRRAGAVESSLWLPGPLDGSFQLGLLRIPGRDLPAILAAVALARRRARGPALRQLLLLRQVGSLLSDSDSGRVVRRLPDRAGLGRGQSAPPDAAISHRPLRTLRLVSTSRRTRVVPAPARHLQPGPKPGHSGELQIHAVLPVGMVGRHRSQGAGVALDLPPGHLVLLLPSPDLHHRSVSQGRPASALPARAHDRRQLLSHYARRADYARAGARAAVGEAGQDLDDRGKRPRPFPQ